MESSVAPAPAAHAAPAARQYHFDRQDCVACHNDPHRTTISCETCHNGQQWKQLKTFDHSSTKFVLEGAHVTVPCAACHKPAGPTAKGAPDFSKTPKQCFECHEDVHGGQFMSGGRQEDCKACHTISKWNSGAFDHNSTSYPLDGFHVRVRCAQCHNQQKEMDGKTIRIYRGAPTDCAKCH
jgi:hypothetical protein